MSAKSTKDRKNLTSTGSPSASDPRASNPERPERTGRGFEIVLCPDLINLLFKLSNLLLQM